MSTEVERKEPYNLPTLADLIDDTNKELALKQDALNYLLNQPTPNGWIKEHPFVNIDVLQPDGTKKKQALQYVPIERVKLTLTMIFREWNSEIISIQQIFNSVTVHVRLKVRNPLTGEWITHDGVGAVGVQTDKGASASDLSAIKQDAVTKAAPAAASYALKNAAEKLGSIFGGALQKYDLTAFTPVYNEDLKQELADRAKKKQAEFLKHQNGTK